MWENTATLKRNLARCAKRRNYVIGSHRNDHITSIQWKNLLFFTVKDQCHPNPCLHDGMCMEVNDELGFLCNCTAGYRGSHCQGTLRDNGIYHTFIYCAFFWLRPRGTWLKLERDVVKGLIIHRPNYDKKSFFDVFVLFIIMSGPEMFQSTKQSTIGDKLFETLSSDGVTLKSKIIQFPPTHPSALFPLRSIQSWCVYCFLQVARALHWEGGGGKALFFSV